MRGDRIPWPGAVLDSYDGHSSMCDVPIRSIETDGAQHPHYYLDINQVQARSSLTGSLFKLEYQGK